MFVHAYKPCGIVVCKVGGNYLYLTTQGKLRKIHKKELALQVDNPCRFYIQKKIKFLNGIPCILINSEKRISKIVLLDKCPSILHVNNGLLENSPKKFRLVYQFKYVD